MARLIYSAIASLDGYVADEDGKFDWAEPDEEVHTFINDLERPVGTHLYGRRLYETHGRLGDPEAFAREPYMQDFAQIWQAADKIVYSRTLRRCRVHGRGSSASSTLKRSGEMKEAADRDIDRRRSRARRPGDQGGAGRRVPRLPDAVRGWRREARALPGDVRLMLDLLDERRFANGMVYLRYRVGADR